MLFIFKAFIRRNILCFPANYELTILAFHQRLKTENFQVHRLNYNYLICDKDEVCHQNENRP